MARKPVGVLFVCMGNICRSPTAQGVFEHIAREQNLLEHLRVDSAGTIAYHAGEAPDRRAQATARKRGLNIAHQQARQVVPADFETFDYIMAMDRENLRELERMKPGDFAGVLDLYCTFSTRFDLDEVPDPYYGGPKGFEHVFDLVEDAAEGLAAHIRAHHALPG